MNSEPLVNIITDENALPESNSKEVYIKKNLKVRIDYRDTKISLTTKQIEVLGFIALGYSNIRIAKELLIKESTVKLLIYRLTKHLESLLRERIDRFYLIIIAQQILKKETISNQDLKEMSPHVKHFFP